MQRQDAISVNHRLAALIASATDIAFATDLSLHPGEKRLAARLAELPGDAGVEIVARIDGVLGTSVAPYGGLIDAVNDLCDSIDTMIQDEFA